MNNRLFVAVTILVFGFLLFIFGRVQSTNTDILSKVAAQQEMILAMQKQAPAHGVVPAAVPPKAVPVAAGGADVSALLEKISVLEARLANLETDAKPIIDQIKAQQEAMERQRREMEEAMRKVYEIEIGNSPVRGKAGAPVTLVEFTDLQCPFCSRFHSVSVDLLKEFPNDLKYVLKHYPLNFHQEAKPAAKAVLAAKEQGKYWEMVDAILKDNSALSAAKYEELAKEIGLNLDKFRKDLKANDAAYEKIITDDIALGNRVNVRGTPAFYLNGKMAQPDMGMLRAAIQEALKK